MEIRMALALPRDELSVPVVRQVLKRSLQIVGVTAEVVADIEVALSEAVTNVLDHAAEGEEYEVSAGIDGQLCVIEVIDRGSGFDADGLGRTEAAPTAEAGRGIQLMRALVDHVRFDNRVTDGTVVHLEKALVWEEDSVIRQLTEAHAPTRHGPWRPDAQPPGDGGTPLQR